MKDNMIQNQEAFELHNKQLQIESEIRDSILFIQEFLDTEFTDENNSYCINSKEPVVIAKTIMHFKKLNWSVVPSVDNDKIKLTFTLLD